jgi:hypothetical protein
VDRLRTTSAVRDSPADGGAGAAYLRRKREQHLARERVEELAAARADELHRSLAPLAVEARRHRVHGPALADRSRPMILNAAYLVDDAAAEEFARAVRDQDARHGEVTLELTGPWPAYSFVSIGPVP